MRNKFILLIILFLNIYKTSEVNASEVFFVLDKQDFFESSEFNQPPNLKIKQKIFSKIQLKKAENINEKKLVAMGLTLFLGHFGAHRIYLGTSTVIPIAYTLTLGGGFGFIPLADFIALAVTKDISRYEDNEKFFMWIKSSTPEENEENE